MKASVGQAQVLLVEDSATQAAAVAKILEQAGHRVDVAHNGDEALRMVANKRPDIVLSDVDMPQMDGLELCRRLKTDPATRTLPIVMLTKYDRITNILRALEAGADNYVTKPVSADVLLTRLSRAINGGDSVANPVADAATAPVGAGAAMLERSQVVELLDATAQKLEQELAAVGEITTLLTMEHRLDALLSGFTERVRALAEANSATVMIPGPSGWSVVVAQTGEQMAEKQLSAAPDVQLPVDEELLKRREPVEIRYADPGTSPGLRAIADRQGLARAYSWPMIHEGELIGHVAITYRDDRDLGADEHRRFRHLADHAAVAVANARAFEREHSLRRQLEEALEAERSVHRDAMLMVATAAEARDGLTGRHLRRVEAYAAALARELGLSPAEIDEISYSSMMHDIGKLLLPESIVGKSGRLTEDEWVQMRAHCEYGAQLLAVRGSFNVAAEIALRHHERWDGTGYPHGLAGESIPLAARITSVADVFDALVTRRSYKDAWPAERAMAEIRSLAGRSFDPAVVEAFLRLWEGGTISSILDRIGEPEPA